MPYKEEIVRVLAEQMVAQWGEVFAPPEDRALQAIHVFVLTRQVANCVEYVIMIIDRGSGGEDAAED